MAKSEQVIGRVAEKRVLDMVLGSNDPELVAIYGRRRVGKTYLIRQHMRSHLVLEVAGIHDQSMAAQLANFHMSLRQAFPIVPLLPPSNWLEPFRLDEVQQYLHYRRIRLDQRQIAMIYMAFGGIPHPLHLIQPGQSAAQCMVETLAASWRYVSKAGSDQEGAQIDLLLDRADQCINICEIN